MGRLIIDGNSIYEIDEACLKRKEIQKRQKEERIAGKNREKMMNGGQRVKKQEEE